MAKEKEIKTGVQAVSQRGITFQIENLEKIIKNTTEEDIKNHLAARKQALQALLK